MKWFKALPANSLTEMVTDIGKDGAWDVHSATQIAVELEEWDISADMVKKWAAVKIDRAKRLLPWVQAVVDQIKELYGAVQNYDDEAKPKQKRKEIRRKSEGNRTDFTPPNPHGSTRDLDKSRLEKNPPTPQGGTSVRFDEFYNSYPKKTSKKQSLDYWKRNKLDGKADQILAGVKHWRETGGFDRLQYVPDPIRFLRNERYLDQRTKPEPAPGVAAPKEDMFMKKVKSQKLQNRGTGELLDPSTLILSEGQELRASALIKMPNGYSDYYFRHTEWDIVA